MHSDRESPTDDWEQMEILSLRRVLQSFSWVACALPVLTGAHSCATSIPPDETVMQKPGGLPSNFQASPTQSPWVSQLPRPFASRTSLVPTLTPGEFVADLASRSISFRTVFLTSSFLKYRPTTGLMLRSEGEVQAFVDTLGPIKDRSLSLMSIDFSKEFGILKTFGSQATLRRCEIFSVEDRGDSLVVHSVRWLYGCSESSGVAMEGLPAHYIAIQATTKKVIFEDPIAALDEEMPENIKWPPMTQAWQR